MMQSYSWNMGWTCPRCNRSYAPNSSECYNCNNQKTTVTTDIPEIKYARDSTEIWIDPYFLEKPYETLGVALFFREGWIQFKSDKN